MKQNHGQETREKQEGAGCLIVPSDLRTSHSALSLKGYITRIHSTFKYSKVTVSIRKQTNLYLRNLQQRHLVTPSSFWITKCSRGHRIELLLESEVETASLPAWPLEQAKISKWTQRGPLGKGCCWMLGTIHMLHITDTNWKTSPAGFWAKPHLMSLSYGDTVDWAKWPLSFCCLLSQSPGAHARWK